MILREQTKAFIYAHIHKIRALDDNTREEFLVALIAIWQNPVIAYMLILNCWQDYYFVCEQCEYCYEGGGRRAGASDCASFCNL